MQNFMGDVVYSSKLAKRHADVYEQMCADPSIGFEEAKTRMKSLLGDTEWWRLLVQEIKKRTGKK
jgi:hypothetical protein